jgi:hypothetical protein
MLCRLESFEVSSSSRYRMRKHHTVRRHQSRIIGGLTVFQLFARNSQTLLHLYLKVREGIAVHTENLSALPITEGWGVREAGHRKGERKVLVKRCRTPSKDKQNVPAAGGRLFDNDNNDNERHQYFSLRRTRASGVRCPCRPSASLSFLESLILRYRSS